MCLEKNHMKYRYSLKILVIDGKKVIVDKGMCVDINPVTHHIFDIAT